MSKLWSPEEDKVLIDSIVNQGLNYSETSNRLNGRSRHAVRHRWESIKNRVDREGRFDSGIDMSDVPKVSLRAAVFDLETMNFKTDGYQDHLVSCCILPLDSDEVTSKKIKFDEDRNDKFLIGRVLEELSKYDILIGHNIAAFDLNWLYSRSMIYGMEMPKSWLYYDTYQVAKTLAIKSASKGLAALTTYFGIESNKTRVQKTEWSKIDSPIRAEFDYAMEMIDEHCIGDVIDNRELFYVLWKYDDKKKLRRTKW